jgi:GNAT superfamily N-acetyltransferase
MTAIVDRLLAAMARSLAVGDRHWSVSSPEWHVAWRITEFRLSGAVKKHVLVIDAIEFDLNFRHRGYGTEFLERLTQAGNLGGRQFDFVAMKDCNTHSLGLGRKCGFRIDDPHFLRVAWKKTRQLSLPFEPTRPPRRNAL